MKEKISNWIDNSFQGTLLKASICNNEKSLLKQNKTEFSTKAYFFHIEEKCQSKYVILHEELVISSSHFVRKKEKKKKDDPFDISS